MYLMVSDLARIGNSLFRGLLDNLRKKKFLGVTKADDWPESLRSLVQEGKTSSTSSASPSYSSASKGEKKFCISASENGNLTNFFYPFSGWSNVGNCSDWTALDPAIVSSSRSQHLSIHNQSLLNNQVSHH